MLPPSHTRIPHICRCWYLWRGSLSGQALFVWHVPTDYSYDAWHISWKLILHCGTKHKVHILISLAPSSCVSFVVFLLIFNSHCWPTFLLCVGEVSDIFMVFLLFFISGHRFLADWPSTRKYDQRLLFIWYANSFTAKKLINPASHTFLNIFSE